MGVEAGLDLSIGVAIGDKLDDISKVLKKEDPKPRYLDLFASGSTLGPTMDSFGHPPSGKIWNILFVTVTGNDDHTNVPNAYASIYVDSDPGSLGLIMCKLPGLAVPSSVSISKGTMWAHSSGDVVLSIAGTGVTNVQASITVAEWEVKDVVAGTNR